MKKIILFTILAVLLIAVNADAQYISKYGIQSVLYDSLTASLGAFDTLKALTFNSGTLYVEQYIKALNGGTSILSSVGDTLVVPLGRIDTLRVYNNSDYIYVDDRVKFVYQVDIDTLIGLDSAYSALFYGVYASFDSSNIDRIILNGSDINVVIRDSAESAVYDSLIGSKTIDSKTDTSEVVSLINDTLRLSNTIIQKTDTSEVAALIYDSTQNYLRLSVVGDSAASVVADSLGNYSNTSTTKQLISDSTQASAVTDSSFLVLALDTLDAFNLGKIRVEAKIDVDTIVGLDSVYSGVFQGSKAEFDSINIQGATKPNTMVSFGSWVSDSDYEVGEVDTVEIVATMDTISSNAYYPIMYGQHPDTSSAVNSLDVFSPIIEVPVYYIGIDSIVFDYYTGANGDSSSVKVDVYEYNPVTGATTFQDSTTILNSTDAWSHDGTVTTFSTLARYDKILIKIKFRSRGIDSKAIIGRLLIYWKKDS